MNRNKVVAFSVVGCLALIPTTVRAWSVLGGSNFGAPSIDGTGSVTYPQPGDIIFDTSNGGSFKGNIGSPSTPNWVTLSAASSSTSESTAVVNLGLSAAIASGALTVTVTQQDGASAPSSASPALIAFRDSTPGSGLYNLRSITSSGTSVVLGTTTSLGIPTATAQYFYIYAIDNSGTVELFASLHPYWDEGSVQTTSTSGTSNSVLFGANVRSNVPVRLIGRVKATWTSGSGWSSVTDISLVPFVKPAVIARVYKTADESFASSATLQQVTMAGVSEDTLNAYSSNAYTVAIAGKYCVDVAGIYKVGSVGFNFASSIRVNSTNVVIKTQNAGSQYGGGSYYPGTDAHWCGTLAVGDTIKFYSTQQNSGSTSYSIGGESAGTSTWMSVVFVGK